MRGRGRPATSLIAVLIGALVLAACGTAGPTPDGASGGSLGPASGGTLTVGTFLEMRTINPLFIDDLPSQEVANLVLATLYDLDPRGNLVVRDTSLAASLPEISAGGRSYTVKLKDTATWTDGRPVTAHDVAWTLRMLADPAVGSPAIANYDKVQDIQVLDHRTVRITLRQVYAPFLYVLAALQPLPSHVFDGVAPQDLKKHPYGVDPSRTVTNGPWKWSEWVPNQRVVLERNDKYWANKPWIDRIVFKFYGDRNTLTQALLKGDIDVHPQVTVDDLAAIEGRQGIRLLESAGPVYEYLGLNFHPDNFPDGFVPWASRKTRQAMAYALNRQGVVDVVLGGHGRVLDGPFLPGSWSDMGTAVHYEYDVERARQLLAEDGWQPGPDGILQKDGHPFEFTLQINSGNDRREKVAAIIQQNLKEVGIQVHIQRLEFNSWIERHVTPGKYQAVLLGWRLGVDPNAESIFSSAYFPPHGQNSGWYRNETIDRLWVQGYSTPDQARRQEVYAQIGRLISEDLPYIFLYTQNLLVAYRDRVRWQTEDQPVLTLPDGWQFNIERWWLSDAAGAGQ